MTHTCTPCLFFTLLWACGGGGGGSGTTTGGNDDTATLDSGSTTGGDGGAVTVELDCSDGTDDDGDGQADCDDSDCSEDYWCNLPDQINFRSQFHFTGNTIQCDLFGIGIDVDVDNCDTVASTSLTQIRQGSVCPDCDRTYQGDLTYTQDTCSALLDAPFPADALYGFVFLDEFNRDLWAQDETGTWVQFKRLTSANGHQWEIVGSEEIWGDPTDCNNGKQNLGTLDLLLTWTDQ
ncbi:MAG: hypothetical protein GXP62_12965 [Oligoflexia bacterium]|nr:hypothetical protein [Oligoflexia bacterium]